ncbi:[protein-PII] uridylyltransferase [Nakamurella antarctica]|uniref:Bifunctional uridylyltransferase/uridylyl-removing enzyme n=1 Tax=Nakamurella antarctica TaxID=1902245 RepID=A0A3G8ZKH3_9ACTN|nr:[protein-PII] uridylyltransferase [Nakamurella antarctica]AZI57819.1 [protein-PII] uridylyltransferase [Nakamurella antarctica]
MDLAVGSGYADLRAQLLGRTGVSGPARRRALARLTDCWLAEVATAAGVTVGGVALVAVGGYGRGELSPFSDLDLVLLHSTETPESYAHLLAERLWYPIWDSRVKLDHAVRSVGGARQIAQTDLPAMLGMLDIRHIAGDPELASALRRRVLADWRAEARNRLPLLEKMCRDRWERSGNLAFATEPNLKESRGGLRDLVVMRAVAASWLADCPHHGLEEARSDLLDIRDALHLSARRGTDRLSSEDHDAVAAALNYGDRDALRTRVASIGRSVGIAADMTWHQVHRVITNHEMPGQVREVAGRFVRNIPRLPLADGVVDQGGEAVLAKNANPAGDSGLPLRAAAAAAQAGVPIASATVSRLARLCPPLPTPWPAPALAAFLSLLGSGESMIPVWESLDQAGVISALLPGWERLRSQPQWDPIHLFTVDRHLMETAVQASKLVRRVSRPDLLLLAAIFHDIGKGTGADHSISGAEMVPAWLQRLGLSPADTETVRIVVLHHLLLSATASRRDPADPATAAAITAVIPDLSTLELLHALSEADARAANPKLWTRWKAAQMAAVVAATGAAFQHPPPRGWRAVGAAASGWSPQDLTEQERSLLDIARGGSLGVGVEVESGGLQVMVTARDRAGLFAATAGALTLNRLSISSASLRVIDGVALLVWHAQPQFGDAPMATTLRSDLINALDGGIDVAVALRKRDLAAAPRVAVAEPVVMVVPEASTRATVLQLRAHDMPGLLYRVTALLTGSGAVITSALIDTHGSEVVDVFYLVDGEGRALAPHQANALAALVHSALTAPRR